MGDEKMNIRFNASIIALAGCLLASPAWAANDEDEINSYVSINAGQARQKNACSSPYVQPGMSCSEKNYAYRLAYGYQFTPAWGIELSYGDLGYSEQKFNYTGTILSTPPVTGPGVYSWSLKTTGWAVAGTGTINIGKWFSLIGKLGGVRAEFNEQALASSPAGWVAFFPTANSASTHVYYGGGAQVNFTQTFSLRLQYEDFGQYDIYNYASGNNLKVKLSMISAAALYKF